jgi:hypothetical protein
MSPIRIIRALAALLLIAISAPAAGAGVRATPVAGPPAPVVAVAPPVAANATGAASAPVAAINNDKNHNGEESSPQALPAEDLLNPDGTLRLDGTFTGALDIKGWNVTLDPDNGPIFSPQALTYTWEHLGSGLEGLLNPPGPVYAIAISGTNVFVGGAFTDAGGDPNADYIARWDGTSWNALGTTPLNNSVRAIAISGSNVYVGGFFTDAGGDPNADRIARWDGTSWNALGTGIGGLSFSAVYAIAITGTDVYVGGNFTDAGGNLNADYIARWDGTTWSELLSGTVGISDTVYAIAISGTEVFVGGSFTNAGGDPNADYIARWDGTSWNALGTTPLNNQVRAIAISGSNVYVGGFFFNAGGDPNADYIARWDGTSWNALGTTPLNGPVYAIAISGNDVYVGGSFTNAGGVSNANNIARWNGTSWNAVGPTPSITGAVFAIAISGNDVYVGGSFTNAVGNNANDYITRWTGTAFVPLGSKTTGPIDGTVNAIAVVGTDVYVGGSFNNAGNVPGANNIARWNSANSTWNLVGAANAINGPVNAIAVSGNDLYVGGFFSNAGGQFGANNIARWNIPGTGWLSVGSSFAINGPVYAIAITGTDVYVGGFFSNAGGVSNANNIARWDGTSWSAVGPTPSITGTVYAIAITGTNVFVGGFFSNAGGVSNANNIARWNGTSWNAVGPTPSINGTVFAIAITGTDVYVGGTFTNAGNVPGANRIARWNIASSNWNLVGAANAINNTVRAITISGNDVYVGGNFLNAGGASAADYLTKWNGTTWTALLSGTAGVYGPVFAIAVPSSNEVYIGGSFDDTGGNPLADRVAVYQTVGIEPTVVSIDLVGASTVTNPTSLQFVVTFSEPVTNVTADDFTLTTTGTPITATVSSVSGSGAVYTVNVTVSGGTAGIATVRLDLKPGTNITDLNGVGGIPAYTTGPAYTVNLVVPTVQAIQLLGTSPITNPTSVPLSFLVTFSEPVTNVTADDFTLTTTGGITVTITGVSGSGAVYTVNTAVGGGTAGTATVRLDLKPNTDIAGTGLSIVGTVPAYTTGPAYTVNLVAPTVQAIQLLGTSPITNPTSLSFPFLVIFSEPVTNVTADDFALTTTGGITATVSSVSGSGAVYTVNTTVGGGTLPPTSTLRLDLKPNTDIVGSVSNVSGTPPYTTGPAYAITSIRVYLPIIVRP